MKTFHRASHFIILASDQSTRLSFSITNGGKSTLSLSLHQQIPNSCIIAQDSYFKVNRVAFSISRWWLRSSFQVLQRHLTMTLSFFPSGGLRGSCGQQRIQAVWQWVRKIFKLILNTYAPLWAKREPRPVCLFVIEVLDALHMDTMMSHVDSWRCNPESFLRERGLNAEPAADPDNEEVFVLIVEGFLIFNHR